MHRQLGQDMARRPGAIAAFSLSSYEEMLRGVSPWKCSTIVTDGSPDMVGYKKLHASRATTFVGKVWWDRITLEIDSNVEGPP